MESNYLDLKSADNEVVNNVLKKYFIDTVLEKDGDVTIKNKDWIYIKIDKSLKALRIFSFLEVVGGEKKISEVSNSVDLYNKASSTVKYSMMKNSIMLEYGFILEGKLDHELLIKTIKHFESEVNDTRENLLDTEGA